MNDSNDAIKPQEAANNGSGGQQGYPKITVRYGKMNHIGEFTYPPNMDFFYNCRVVVSTERGIEMGRPLELTMPNCPCRVPDEQMYSYAESSGGDTYRLNAGRVLRQATADDLNDQRHITESAFEKVQTCRRLAGEVGLDIKVVDCEQILGGERIVFYFMAEERVDFRELVRRLASEFQTRIEMRQIGARDEARLLADYETCGRECCCKNFLKNLKPVTMSMAKLQKTTLDLSKVSGRCGRLKCCLRYENEHYDTLNKKLPRTGTWVRTEDRIGKVIERQVLCQLLKIKTADQRIVVVPLDEIVETGVTPPPQQQEESEDGDDTNNGSNGRRSHKNGSYNRSQNREQSSDQPPAAPGVQAEGEQDQADEASSQGDEQQDNEDDQGLSRRARRKKRGRRGHRGRRRRNKRDNPSSGSSNE
jgi:cell fate regulator YaaT (PSP1 superfamily)